MSKDTDAIKKFYAERPKGKLKKVYSIFSMAYGESDVLFDENDKIIDWWNCNDASWRSEYFSGVLAFFGYEDADVSDKKRKKLEQIFRDYLVESGMCDKDDLDKDDLEEDDE